MSVCCCVRGAPAMLEASLLAGTARRASNSDAGNRTPPEHSERASRNGNGGDILAEGAMILSVTLSGDVLFAS